LRLPEAQRRLLKSKQQGAGPLRLDAIGGQGVHDFEESDLHIGQGFQGRKVQLEGGSTATDMGTLVAAIEVALMEVAELLAAKGGRTTEDAIGLAMATGGTGHDCLLKTGLNALRFSQFAFRERQGAQL
jgi:hypothetical protein